VHTVIDPSVLYVGTPAYLIATTDRDGRPNLAPASSYWALGRMLVLGIETDGQTSANLHAHGELTRRNSSARGALRSACCSSRRACGA
jgi:flavin reductase (DIM6/NTAB) family NADH-FMN oxidoreductase RutF